MGKMKEQEIKFVCVNEPDEECIDNFHKALAQGLINKYGVDMMKEVVNQIEQRR